MIPLIEDNRDAIADLCRQYGVQKLAVFGSAVNGTWDPDHSDLDFVLEMADYERGVARRFIRFGNSLETLLGRPVDLVIGSSLKNPWFRHEVLSTMKVLVNESSATSHRQIA